MKNLLLILTVALLGVAGILSSYDPALHVSAPIYWAKWHRHNGLEGAEAYQRALAEGALRVQLKLQKSIIVESRASCERFWKKSVWKSPSGVVREHVYGGEAAQHCHERVAWKHRYIKALRRHASWIRNLQSAQTLHNLGVLGGSKYAAKYAKALM